MNTKLNKLAFMAAVMITVVTGTNMLEANNSQKYEKLRIAPVHKKFYAYRNPGYTPAVASTSYMIANKNRTRSGSPEKDNSLAGTHTLIQ